MNELEWLASDDPQAMLTVATRDRRDEPSEHDCEVSDRKLRLFACACCRQIWHLLTDERSRRAVEVAERYADGMVTKDELELASNAANDYAASVNAGYYTFGWLGFYVAEYRDKYLPDSRREVLIHTREAGVTPAIQANLLRCIVGNPFKPVINERQYVTDARSKALVYVATARVNAILPELADIDNEQDAKLAYRHAVERCVFRQAWLTPAVLSLAQAIYDDHDFALMPILGDALIDAGCDNEEVLNHCREPGPHGRGCWVVDLLLGLE